MFVQEIRKTITIAAIDHAINSLEKEGAIELLSNRQFAIVALQKDFHNKTLRA